LPVVTAPGEESGGRLAIELGECLGSRVALAREAERTGRHSPDDRFASQRHSHGCPQKEDLQSPVRAGSEALGSHDILVNAAGLGIFGPGRFQDEDFENLIETNSERDLFACRFYFRP